MLIERKTVGIKKKRRKNSVVACATAVLIFQNIYYDMIRELHLRFIWINIEEYIF
jgi:hypothetical protein